MAEYVAEELEVGINENRPNIVEYFSALRASGFKIEVAAPAMTLNMNRDGKIATARHVNAIWPQVHIRRSRLLFRQLYDYYLKRIQALRMGRLAYLRVPNFLNADQRLEYRILQWSDLELFLIASLSDKS